jgi:protein phosphatase
VATAVVRYTAAAITDRGRKRTSNEDAFGYSVEHGVYLVCDGMGGAAAGEIASSLAVEEVLRLLTTRIEALSREPEKATGSSVSTASVLNASLNANLDAILALTGTASDGHGSNGHASNGHASNGHASSGHASNGHASSERTSSERTSSKHTSMPELAEEAVFAANEAIHARSQRNMRLSGMGTTLVGILAGPPETLEAESRLWILNVGDSRCYRLRDGHIELCTQDHSLVEEQIRMGRMTRAEAARSPLRNVITRALGTQGSVTPDVIESAVEPGDLFLLCSDGLTRELADETIEEILNAPVGGLNPRPASLDQLCENLVQAANKAGGNDNITCLIVRVD